MAEPTSLPTAKTVPLYQKDMYLHTHTSPISTLQPLSSLPEEARALFKPPPDGGAPYILTTPSTIFHAQGGGQPSDTGTIKTPGDAGATFSVHQVRKAESAILHMGTFADADNDATKSTHSIIGTQGTQELNIPTRLLHSRLHTAGHLLGLAASDLKNKGLLDPSITDGKASHYPSASFVEFSGLIPTAAKPLLQEAVDALVARDLAVEVSYWSEERARMECTGVLESFKQDGGEEEGVRVVAVGDVGSYPCGGTHVRRTGECGRVVVRNVKRQKGVTKVSYEVQDV